MKKHIITIAGRPGSGKSTASSNVASQLGYQHFSSGDFFRVMGKERGMDLHQITLAAEREEEIDRIVDQKLRDIGDSEDEIVIDSRMAWHWMPFSFKVFLELDLMTAAERIIRKMDPARVRHEHIPSDPAKYVKLLQRRLDSEILRYKKLYNADPFNKSNYDLVIDTAITGPGEVVKQIIQAYKDWQSK